MFIIIELEKLTRAQLISLAKECGIRLKHEYQLNKLDIIRIIRRSKVKENNLRDVFFQYVNLYYCEFCGYDHYFDSDIGKRHLKYMEELRTERQRAGNKKINRINNAFVKCKYCGKTYMNQSFLKKHINKNHFAPVNLHRMPLKEAILYVISKLEDCINRGVDGLKLIHGYHHGTVLRDYFRSEKFKKDMKRVGLIIGISNIRDLGYTLINVNIQTLQKGKYCLN